VKTSDHVAAVVVLILKVMRILIGLTAASASLLLLANCGGSHNRPAASRLIVLDRSIGGVALRQRRAVVGRLLGRGIVRSKQDQKPPEPPAHVEDVVYPNGLEVIFVSRDAASRLLGRAIVVRTFSPSFATRHGVRVGSPESAVRSIQGVTCGSVLNHGCQHGGHVHNRPGTFFASSGPNGKIVSITIAYAD
jgi:hypothetical protein